MSSCTPSRSSPFRVLLPWLLAAACLAGEPEEKALAALWQLHQKNPSDHGALAEACRAFRQGYPNLPVAAVARGLEAWHLLKDGRVPEAEKALRSMAAAGGDATARAGLTMGNRWLARIDREKVREALRKAYARDIRFPDSLEALARMPGLPAFPRADPWGKPWTYRIESFRRFGGMAGQRYRLESPALGAASDLAEALAVPYGSRIALKPVRLAPGTGPQPMLFETTTAPARQALLSEGTSFEEVVFAYDGTLLVVLSDGDHWLILPRPRQGAGR